MLGWTLERAGELSALGTWVRPGSQVASEQRNTGPEGMRGMEAQPANLLPNPGARSMQKLKRTGQASAGPRGSPVSPAINSSGPGGDNPVFKNTIFNVYVRFASL